MSEKVWLITGTSKGFGKEWAEAALELGDKVVATARNISSLDDLHNKYGDSVLPIKLDVTSRQDCFEAIDKAMEHFGKIDILISNAGYGHFGYVEEISESEARSQIETNVFGSIWIIQAVLPIMRKQKSGNILQVTSVGGIVAFPILSLYHASKWAMEGFCESLNQEVAQFGIKVTLIEPGGYSTDWGTTSAVHSKPIAAYDQLRNIRKANVGNIQLGKPEATRDAILKIVDAENPPLRLILGSMPWKMIEPTYMKRMETWEEWLDVSEKAQG